MCARARVVFSLPVVRSDNYYHRLAVGGKKKKAGKHSQVPDPSLNLTDKLSGIVEELHSSLTFLCSAGIFADKKCVLTPALKQEMFSETFFFFFLKVTTWSLLSVFA